MLGIIANLFKFLDEMFLRIHTLWATQFLNMEIWFGDPILNLIKQLLEKCSIEPLGSWTYSNTMLITNQDCLIHLKLSSPNTGI